MKVRDKKTGATGHSGHFNTHGLGEMIVGFDADAEGREGGQDSCYISDFEFYIEALGAWVDSKVAFDERHVIIDNYNTRFFEPRSTEDRSRGYTL